jgi:hypothetical protein
MSDLVALPVCWTVTMLMISFVPSGGSRPREPMLPREPGVHANPDALLIGAAMPDTTLLPALTFASLVLASAQAAQPLPSLSVNVQQWLGMVVITSFGVASLIFCVLNPVLIAALFGQI